MGVKTLARIEYLTIDKIPASHPVVKFHQLWTGWRTGDGFPLWDSFKAKDHPGIVPWMMVFEKIADQKYRYKFAGTSVEQLFGVPLQGKMFGSAVLPEDFVNRVTREFELIEAGAEPSLGLASLPYEAKAHKSVYRGIYGFCGEDGIVSRIVAVVASQETRVT